MVMRHGFVSLLVALTGACNVASTAGPTTGTGGADSDAGTGSGTCLRAIVVTDSDYQSTNISVVSPAGKVQTQTLISSGSSPPGLTEALSGDMGLPHSAPTSGRVVLLDHTNAVVTWVDPASAKVEGQLSVATGFASNPQDYLEVSSSKAYVTRYATNLASGAAPFDEGGDVVVVDTSSLKITKSISLAAGDDGAFQPTPTHLLLRGTEAWVTLDRMAPDFATAGDARIIGIDTTKDSKTFTVTLAGMASCDGLAVSPSGTKVALSCSGVLVATPPSLDRTGVVLLDATKIPPVEIRRFLVAQDLKAPPGFALSFASENVLVGTSIGSKDPARNDTAYALDLTNGKVTPVADGGAAFVLGDIRCTPGCGDRCVLTDAQANKLRIFNWTGKALVESTSVSVDPDLGLPPRLLGEIGLPKPG